MRWHPAETIRRHPLASFFTLAIGGSWLAWIPFILSQSGLGVWDFRFPVFLGTSQFTGMLPGAYLGPIASAFLVTYVADGPAGVRAWRGRLWRWRVNWRWYVVAIVGGPAGMLAAGAAFSGGNIQAPTAVALIAYFPALLLQLVTTGLAEEPGWRDFALPRMQRTLGPLRGSLVLGCFWALWHLPLFFTEWGGWPTASWGRPLFFIGFCITFSVIMTWVFNRTGESLPLAMLLHVSLNNFASIIWSGVFPTVTGDAAMLAMFTGSGVVSVLVVAATRGRLGYGQARRKPRDVAV